MNFANIFKTLKQVTLNAMDIKFLKAKTDILATKLNKDVHSTLTSLSEEVHDTRSDIANIKDVTDKIEFTGDKISSDCLPSYVESVKDVYVDEDTGDFYNVETVADPVTLEVSYELGSTIVLKVPGIIYYDVNLDKLYRVSESNKSIEITTSTLYYTKSEVDTRKQDKLTSGVNIKTINGESLLGEGNMDVIEVFNIGLSDIQLIKNFDVNTHDDLNIANYGSPLNFINHLNDYGYSWEEFGTLCLSILLNINKTIVIERNVRIGPNYVVNKSIVISKHISNTNFLTIVLTIFDEKLKNTITYNLTNVYLNLWISRIEQKNNDPLVVEFVVDYSTEDEIDYSGTKYDCSVNKTTAQIYEAWLEGREIYAYDNNFGTILYLSMPPLENIAIFSGTSAENYDENNRLTVYDDGTAVYSSIYLLNKLYFDSEPTENSNRNIVSSGTIFDALNKKLNKVLFGCLEKNSFTEGKYIRINKNNVYLTTSDTITPEEGMLYADIKYGKLYTWFGDGVGFIQIS